MSHFSLYIVAFGALTLWLGGRKSTSVGFPADVKIASRIVSCLVSYYLSGVRCRLAYGPADATVTHCLLL